MKEITAISGPAIVILIILFTFLVIWSVIWKGLALWKSARKNSPIWFIFLLILNTAGILSILYIFIFSEMKTKKKKKRKKKQIYKQTNPKIKMKKVAVFLMAALFLVSLMATGVLAEQNQTLGGCGAVTPGLEDECCNNLEEGYIWSDTEEACVPCLGCDETDNNETETDECDSTHLELCLSETDCTDAEGFWYNDLCNEEAEEIEDEDEEQNQTENRERNREKQRIHFEAKTGQECPEDCTCTGSTVKCGLPNGGREMTVYAGNSGNVIFQVKGINASTRVELYKTENGTVYRVDKNNRTKNVNVLPDQAQSKIKAKTRANLEKWEIELDEDGIYRIQMQKKARLFFLFPVREKVNAEVDSESGEVKIRNPWWGFLARDVSEDNEEPEVTNFDECIAAGFPAMESDPRQCSDGEGTFTEILE